MKTRTGSTAILIFFVVAVGVGVGLYFLWSSQLGPSERVSVSSTEGFGWKFPIAKFPSTGLDSRELAYSNIRDPGGIPRGLPVRLTIPVIGVNSLIEDALITPDGRMDVPEGSKNVAWFALGPHPGQTGSAVIGGHFGIRNGVPFVFYDLDKLKVGDKVHVEDDEGNVLTFMVRSIRLFDRNADATSVFSSDDGIAHLNLITCEGIWNRVDDTYPDRRVVFTDLVKGGVESEAEAEVEAELSPLPVFSRSLNVGARGADVVALQVILEEKGFLVMPPGIAKGFFGTLTREAVAKYQSGAGLPSYGFFGPLTIARLVEEWPRAQVKPTLPSTALVPESTSTTILTVLVERLYGTPLDGLITSFLLVLIFFMAVKVIIQRRNLL